MDRAELETLDRESLVIKAQQVGIRRARILTRPELVDELLRLDPQVDKATLEKSRGFFGRARDLLARVVERGLHLPDAAERIRAVGEPLSSVPRVEPQAVPTVTLAEIYAAQGHRARAVETLERVLEREPDHVAARMLMARLTDSAYVPPPPPLPPEPEVEAVPALAAEEGGEDAGTIALGGAPREAADDSVVAGGLAREEEETVGGAPRLEDTVAVDGAPRGASESDVVANAIAQACVVVPIAPGAVFTWWRIGLFPVDRPFVVRVVVVTPSWDGPVVDTRDLEVDPGLGELFLDGLPERAVVRAAIGFGTGDDFVPVAHAPLLEAAPRAIGGPSGLVQWTVEGRRPVVLDDAAGAPIVQAVLRARAAVRELQMTSSG